MADKRHPTGEKFKEVADELFDGKLGKLAEALGMKPESFSKYTTGRTHPGHKILKRLIALDINLNWFLSSIPPMKISDIDQAQVSKIEMQNGAGAQDAEQYVDELYSAFEGDDLNPAEAQFLAEIKQFSLFLESRPLNPHVKRLLLELLIESIDQAVEQPPRDPTPSAGD